MRLTGVVEKLYNNCPTQHGWTGWFFELDSQCRTVRCTMKTGGSWIREGMSLTIEAERVLGNRGDYEYAVESADVAPTRLGVMRYLTGKEFVGIGAKTASKLYDIFDNQILNIIDNDPDAIRAAGFSDKVVSALVSGRMVHSISSLLRLLNLKPSMIEKIEKKYGRAAIDIIKKNPYVLLKDFAGERGFNFKNVDQLALQLGVDPNSQVRIDEAVYYVISNYLNQNGHLCVDLSETVNWNSIFREAVTELGLSYNSASVISNAIRKHGALRIVQYPHGVPYGHSYCYTDKSYADEFVTATHVDTMLGAKPLIHIDRDEILLLIDDYEMLSGKQLDDVQKEAVIMSLQNRLSIITGGPGCGKTTVVACVLYVWRRKHMPVPVLSAPTGLAAKRMQTSVLENASGYRDDDAVVKTIARRLCEARCVNDFDDDDQMKPYAPTLAIIDETSMVNMADAAKILSVFRNCQLVFVGDADQLPAIDPGDFFSDLCSLDFIPKQSLNICYRAVNSQAIIDNARKIRDGLPVFQLDWSKPSFKMQEFQADDMNAVNYMVNQYIDYINRGYDYSEICILSPVRRGALGVEHLNYILQSRLNPEVMNSKSAFHRVMGGEMTDVKGVAIDDTEYLVHCDKTQTGKTKLRVGDRVIQMKNRYDKSFVNGDCGIIIEYHKPDISHPYIKLQLDDGRSMIVEHEEFSELALAYAVTVHKAQGCEYQHVMIAMPHSLLNYGWYETDFANRNLVYTAGTRAKLSVEFVGSKDLLQQCIDTKRRIRQSLFCNRITDSHNGIRWPILFAPAKNS